MKLPSNPVGAHPSTYKGHLVSLEVLCHYAKKGDVKELPIGARKLRTLGTQRVGVPEMNGRRAKRRDLV